MGSRRSGTSRFCQIVQIPQVPIFLPAGPGGGGQASCSGETFLFTPRRGACPPQDTQWGSVLQAAVCHILFVPPLCPVYLLRGVPSRGPGPWQPPCPAGCCGVWWRATTLALLSSLDALQVCVCTCGKTQAWPCFLAGKHVGPGVAGPLRCASGAGGDPSPPP